MKRLSFAITILLIVTAVAVGCAPPPATQAPAPQPPATQPPATQPPAAPPTEAATAAPPAAEEITVAVHAVPHATGVYMFRDEFEKQYGIKLNVVEMAPEAIFEK
jgi:ABC-type glycerol-3-phosphate transport system substrate-binding protein